VCISAVFGGLAVWRHNNQEKKQAALGGGVPLVGPQEDQRGPS